MSISMKLFRNLLFRSLFLKFVLSFIVLIILFTITLASLLNLWFERDAAEKKLDKLGMERIQETKYFTDALLRDIDEMVVHIGNLEAVKQALHNGETAQLHAALLDFGSDLRLQYMSSYAVNSIHLYIKDAGMYQIPIFGGQSQFAVDPDSVVTALDQTDKRNRWLIRPAPRTGSETLPDRYVLLVRPLPLLGSAVEGAVLVSFDTISMFESPFVQRENELIWIVPSEGQAAFEARSGMPVPNDLYRPVAERLREGNLSFRTVWSDSDFGFRIQRSAASDWYYVYGARIEPLNGWSVFAAVLFAALSVGWTLYTARKARRIHGYIRQLNGLLEARRSPALDQAGPNEFSALISGVHSMLEKESVLQQRLQISELQMKQGLLAQYLQEPTVFTEERSKQLKEWGVDDPHAGYFVAVLRIDDYPGFCNRYSRMDQQLLRYFSAKMAEEEQGNGQLHVLSFDTKERDVVLLCFLRNALTSAAARTTALQCVNAICGQIHSYLQITVSVGIGDVLTDVGCISESYRQALQALEFGYYKGPKALTPIWHAQLNQQILLVLFEERKQIEKDLEQAIRDAEPEKAVIHLRKLRRTIDCMEGCPVSLVHHTLWELVMVMLHSRSGSGASGPDEIKLMHLELQKQDSLPQAFEWAERAAASIAASAGEAQPARTLLDDIIQYVQANFDKEISLNSIADQLRMDPSYVSRYFKQTAGVNFMDYLLSLRMKHAKLLLSTTDRSVSDIALAVGYINSASFIRIFKKHEGMTPGQYRAIYAQQPKLRMPEGG